MYFAIKQKEAVDQLAHGKNSDCRPGRITVNKENNTKQSCNCALNHCHWIIPSIKRNYVVLFLKARFIVIRSLYDAIGLVFLFHK